MISAWFGDYFPSPAIESECVTDVARQRMTAMTVTLWMAMSLNGITAREDQSEDFLSNTDWEMCLELVRASDALVWGRVTHELFEQPIRSQFTELPIVVVTRNNALALKRGSMRASSPEEAVAMLEKRGSTNVLLAGGSRVNAGFARAGLIDEVVLAI
jgi:dihydrofolate reductase